MLGLICEPEPLTVPSDFYGLHLWLKIRPVIASVKIVHLVENSYLGKDWKSNGHRTGNTHKDI